MKETRTSAAMTRYRSSPILSSSITQVLPMVRARPAEVLVRPSNARRDPMTDGRRCRPPGVVPRRGHRVGPRSPGRSQGGHCHRPDPPNGTSSGAGEWLRLVGGVRTTTRSRPFRSVRSRMASLWRRRAGVRLPPGGTGQGPVRLRCVRAGFEAREGVHRWAPDRPEEPRSDSSRGRFATRLAAGRRVRQLALRGRPGADPPAKITAPMGAYSSCTPTPAHAAMTQPSSHRSAQRSASAHAAVLLTRYWVVSSQ